MPEPIISVSGLRGIVGESLTPEVAVRYAAAFAAGLPPGPVLVSHDGRTTGPMFLQAIREGLSRLGRNVFDCGIAATPTTGVLVRQWNAVGGIQISASHNPPEYNGLKLFSSAGRVVPREAGEEVIARYRAATTPVVNSNFGRISTINDTISAHRDLVMNEVDGARIRSRHPRVLLDSNHGSGSLLGQDLLALLNCHVQILGGQPNGLFAHPPEPTEENLREVAKYVVEMRADIGFCQDPDADRLAIIDERGRYIGEEYTLAICANHVLSQRPGPVVTNCSSSRMLADIAAKHGVPFHQSAVGEANVVDAMLATEAVVGGEGNGGVIDPRVVLVRDSFVAMALVLDAMATRQLPVSALADELPRYEICKTKIALPREKLTAAYDALQALFADAAPSRLDGLRLDWPDRWLLVRGSNTEPIVRAIAEAPTPAAAETLCREAAALLASLCFGESATGR